MKLTLLHFSLGAVLKVKLNVAFLLTLSRPRKRAFMLSLRRTTHGVVQFLQARNCQEVVNVDTVFNQQLNKVNAVQDQRIHHGLFQGVHLSPQRSQACQR